MPNQIPAKRHAPIESATEYRKKPRHEDDRHKNDMSRDDVRRDMSYRGRDSGNRSPARRERSPRREHSPRRNRDNRRDRSRERPMDHAPHHARAVNDRDRASDRGRRGPEPGRLAVRDDPRQQTSSSGAVRRDGARMREESPPTDEEMSKSRRKKLEKLKGNEGRRDGTDEHGDEMDQEDDFAGDEDTTAVIMRVMGFQNFKSTQNTKVPGNDKLYGVRKEKATQYRQYMNRPGGFNRPLSPSRQ